ncbi:MAG: AAA family ATPase [Actinomycetota bacterium]|nr:AAA family ATPase [Actinomycetota bacterium]
MGDRVTSIEVQAFRGVPESLAVPVPEGRSLVVLGDNGTGKSTIADALEFFFTGRIEFLRHEGRQHAIRHVGAASNTQTLVKVEISGDGGGVVTHPSSQGDYQTDAYATETFLLRGRTLVEFVELPKAEKWKALAHILGLDDVDELRLRLQRVKNELRREARNATSEVNSRAASLKERAGSVTEESILDAITGLCDEAGVVPPQSFTQALDPAWAKQVTGADTDTERAVRMKSLAGQIRVMGSRNHDLETIKTWNATVEAADPQGRSRLTFYRAADSLLSSETFSRCPLCERDIDPEGLKTKVVELVASLNEVFADLNEKRQSLVLFLDGFREMASKIQTTFNQSAGLGVQFMPVPKAPAVLGIDAELLGELDVDEVEVYMQEAQGWLNGAAEVLEKQAPLPANQARAKLIAIGSLAADARTWRDGKEAEVRTEAAAALAEAVFDSYQLHQRQYVELILDRISGRVSDIYRKLHPGEDLTEVRIEPWTDKGVELALQFHGIPQKPPHGVLSESHLNSLAIALFLSMAEAFNERTGFIVLDDVVNSFDLDHRGQLARLLVDEFDSWQLIVLTHDEQFYEQIRRRAPQWRKLEFTSWSYEGGPRTTAYETAGMLEKAKRCLPDDRIGAAQKGRRSLEELLQEICEALEAPLPFRRGVKNDHREPGELIAGLRRKLKDVSKPFLTQIEDLLRDIEADLAAALNVESHAARGRASAPEIATALDRIETLEAVWSCDACGSRLWHRGSPDSSRCKCGKSVFPPAIAS